jgi:tol-pal system protein YbgF
MSGRKVVRRQAPGSRPHRRFCRGLLLPLLLPALLAGTACASGGQQDESDQIRELQERVLELQRKAAVNEVEIGRLRQQVADLLARQDGGSMPAPHRTSAAPPPHSPYPNTSLSSLPTNRPPTGVPPGTVIDESEIEVPLALTGPAAPAAPMRSPTPAPRTAPPPAARSQQRAQAPPPPSPPAAVPPAPAGAGAGSTAPSHAEPVTPAVQALYDRGYTLYHQKHYVDAEASFQRFLQAEPQSELADNAQYWIGECRYSRGDMRGALAAFRETVSRYPQGNKAPDALLKAGMSLEALGDHEGARTTYQEVLHRYPGTAVAAVAEERRAKLP